MPGLPGRGSRVCVGPPLAASGAEVGGQGRRGNVRRAAVLAGGVAHQVAGVVSTCPPRWRTRRRSGRPPRSPSPPRWRRWRRRRWPDPRPSPCCRTGSRTRTRACPTRRRTGGRGVVGVVDRPRRRPPRCRPRRSRWRPSPRRCRRRRRCRSHRRCRWAPCRRRTSIRLTVTPVPVAPLSALSNAPPSAPALSEVNVEVVTVAPPPDAAPVGRVDRAAVDAGRVGGERRTAHRHRTGPGVRAVDGPAVVGGRGRRERRPGDRQGARTRRRRSSRWRPRSPGCSPSVKVEFETVASPAPPLPALAIAPPPEAAVSEVNVDPETVQGPGGRGAAEVAAVDGPAVAGRAVVGEGRPGDRQRSGAAAVRAVDARRRPRRWRRRR